MVVLTRGVAKRKLREGDFIEMMTGWFGVKSRERRKN